MSHRKKYLLCVTGGACLGYYSIFVHCRRGSGKKNCDDEEDDDDSEYSPNSDTQDEDEDTSDYSAQRTLPLRRPRKPAVSITAYSRGNALA